MTDAGIDHDITERKGVITLGRIAVPWESRSKGVGTAAMQKLVDYADASGQRIELGASSQMGGDKARLIEFYERFGFTRKPRSAPANKPWKDTAMTREPQPPTRYKLAGEAPDTPEFKRWFGASKVVDKAGKPLAVYHGTGRDFDTFDAKAPSSHIPLPGFYFTPDPDIASTFAESAAKMQENRAGRPFAPIGANVKPSYLSLQNPLDVDVADGVNKGFVSEKIIKDIIQEAKRRGHDGLILRGWKDGSGPIQYVVFEPTQIKSSIGNRGTFDPADPNITHKRGGLPAKPFKQRVELENTLRAKLGHKLVDGLLQRNVITLGDAPADVPRDAQGRFTGSTVELFHNRLDAATAPGVLMHEVGAHYGMEKMLGEQRYLELLADLRKLRQRPEVAKAWQTVRRNYPDLQEGDAHFVEEVAAHLVETAPDRPIVRRMLDAPRAYLYREFGVNLGRVDPDLLRAMAVGALRKSAGVEALSPNPTALATAGARQQREEEPAAAQ